MLTADGFAISTLLSVAAETSTSDDHARLLGMSALIIRRALFDDTGLKYPAILTSSANSSCSHSALQDV